MLQSLQHANHSARRQAGIDLDRQTLARAFIDNIQRAETFAAIQRIVHKIQCPLPIRKQTHLKRLCNTVVQYAWAIPASCADANSIPSDNTRDKHACD